jgi:Transposase IS4
MSSGAVAMSSYSTPDLNSLASGLVSCVNYLLVFDLETSARSWKTNCIIQMAARLVAIDDAGVLLPYELGFDRKVLLPVGKRISPAATKVHGIKACHLTPNTAVALGVALKALIAFVEAGCEALSAGRSASSSDESSSESGNDSDDVKVALVAHNGMAFDFRILLRSFCEQGVEWPRNWCLFVDTLAILRGLCRSKKTILNLPKACGGGASAEVSKVFGLSLGVLYTQLTGTLIEDAHNALADTDALLVVLKSVISAPKSVILRAKFKRGVIPPTRIFKMMKAAKGVDLSVLEGNAAFADDSEDDTDILVDFEAAADAAEDGAEFESQEWRWQEIIESEDGRAPERQMYGSRGRRAPTRPSIDTLEFPFVANNEVVRKHAAKYHFGTPLQSFLHFFSHVALGIVEQTNIYAAQKATLASAEAVRDRGERECDKEKGARKAKRKDKSKRKRRRKRVRNRWREGSSSSPLSSPPSPPPAARASKRQRSHRAKWRDLTVDELHEFVSCLLILGVTQRKSRRSAIWGADVKFAVPYVQSVMTRDRFEQILSNLHFADNDELEARGHPNYDPIGKVRPLIDSANKVFCESYVLGAYVSADECSKGFCGRASHRKSMKHKPMTARFGFNVFSVHCAFSSYLHQFELQYAGLLERCQESEVRLATITNLHTMMPLYLLRNCLDGIGHADALGEQHWPIIVCDRLYSSFRLAKEATERRFHLLGTVRAGAAGMPKHELLPNNQKGRTKYWKLNVPKKSRLRALAGSLAINYCDSKSFMLLSTVPPDNFIWDPRRTTIKLSGMTVPRRRDGASVRQPAPNLVCVYNITMNGADRFDQAWSRCEIGVHANKKVDRGRVFHGARLHCGERAHCVQLVRRDATVTSRFSSGAC